MKKLVLLMVLVCFVSFAFATLDWVGNSYIVVNSTWYDGSADAQANDFDAYDFGTISSLTLGGEVQSWDMSGDVAYLYYQIDSDASVNFALPWERQEGSNDLWQHNSETTVDISGLSDGAHTLTIWFKVTDNDAATDQYDNNGGDNYVASFTTSSPSPITLASFVAEANKGKVELAWVTESETENSHFLVYRDGEVIAQVEGAGTATESNEYEYVDEAVVPGTHSYAIADVSYGGVEVLHDAVTVEVGTAVAEASFALNKAYPNPFNPRVALSMEYGVGSNTVLNIYNTQGALVENLINGFVEAGHHEVIWDASDMTSGVYIVKMIVGDVVQSQKVVLMK